MQQSDFELKNGYQMIPVAIAAVAAVVVGCVTHFFKPSFGGANSSTVTLFTTAGVLILYGYDLNWMKGKIFELKDAVSMEDVRFSQSDWRILRLNLLIILCYILLSVVV